MGAAPERRRALIVRSATIASVLMVGVLGARAYFDWEPARIIVERDSLRLYGGGWTRLPYRVVTRRGEEVGWARAVMTGLDFVRESDGMGLACSREGEGELLFTLGEASATMHVRCRFARSISGPTEVETEVGAQPERVEFRAAFASGETEVIEPVYMSMSDTVVARLEDGRIVPLSVGRTSLHMEFGGGRNSLPVSVVHAIARDTLELRPGEFRTWPLVPGRYEITVRSLAGARNFEELEMIAEGTKCVPNGRDRDMIHCLVTDTAVVALHNRHPAGAPRSSRTAVWIIRTQ